MNVLWAMVDVLKSAIILLEASSVTAVLDIPWIQMDLAALVRKN